VGKIKILIVDDHAIMRDGIRALLNLHDDIEVVGEASEGKEAVEKSPRAGARRGDNGHSYAWHGRSGSHTTHKEEKPQNAGLGMNST